MNYKEIINPFAAVPLIILLNYFIGSRGFDLFLHSFVVFFVFSFVLNIVLVLIGFVYPIHYMFVYIELSFSLVFLIPLFYFIGIDKPFIAGIFILGLVDFIIQGYYNIFPGKDTWGLTKAWGDKLVRSERIWFHPISMQRYVFRDFTCEIVENGKSNPTANHVLHHHFMSAKTAENIVKRKFGNKNTIFFDIEDIGFEKNDSASKGMRIDKNIYSMLKKIDKTMAEKIITCYKSSYIYNKNICRIVFEKDFVLDNPKRVYNFLKKVKERKSISEK